MKPYYQEDGITIYCGDCREIVPGLSVDSIVSDPPYGIGYHRQTRSRGTSTIRSSGGVYGHDWGAIVGDDAPFDPAQLLALNKPTILWGANCYASRLPDSAGWLIWDKKRGGTIAVNFAGSAAELAWTNFLGHIKWFAHLWDGLRRDTEIGIHLHPTQKPVALLLWCLELLPNSGMVLDPFMGSGTTLRAAKDLGRKAIGIEIEERYCAIAARRLEQQVLDFGGGVGRG